MKQNMNYEEVEAVIQDLPQTWYPALLVEIVKAALKKNVFQPGGAARLVGKVEGAEGKLENPQHGHGNWMMRCSLAKPDEQAAAHLLTAVKAIKETALSTTDAARGLSHIVRLCIDAEKKSADVNEALGVLETVILEIVKHDRHNPDHGVGCACHDAHAGSIRRLMSMLGLHAPEHEKSLRNFLVVLGYVR